MADKHGSKSLATSEVVSLPLIRSTTHCLTASNTIETDPETEPEP
jgi:hypothetical protein